MLLNIHAAALDECVEVKAAIAYAQQDVNGILLLEDCWRKGKKLTFYGRVDGTCPIDLRILAWFLKRNSPNAVCKLVPHWLHAKVIWWVGEGVYIGSANLTDRAWNQNFEAGIYLTHAEIEQFDLVLELEEFFDGLEQYSFALDQNEYERQVELEKRRADLLKKLRKIESDYEAQHWRLKDQSSPNTVAGSRRSKDMRMAAFQQEWSQTLQLIRSIGSRAALDENRPSWIDSNVPQGVQGDQFLHAYYYQVVKPSSEKNAYLREFEKNRKNPEAALEAALTWWKSGAYEHHHEEKTIYESSRLLRTLFAKDRIRHLSKEEWVEALTNVYAFRDHASKINNRDLGLGIRPGNLAKGVALANITLDRKTKTGMSAADVFEFVIWGQGDVAERLWRASHEPKYKLSHISENILGEVVGWARPTEYPPRNSRTNKALCALGNKIEGMV
jgi:hypothetical protein